MKTDVAGMGVIEQAADGVTVRFERHFPSPPSAVWRALTDPDQLAQWLSDASVDLRVGGAIQVRFDDGTMDGVITDLQVEAVLAYSWHESESNESHVRWEIAPGDGAGTMLRLTHVKLPAESAPGFGAGWHHHLDRLEGVVGGRPMEWSWKTFEELEPLYRA